MNKCLIGSNRSGVCSGLKGIPGFGHMAALWFPSLVQFCDQISTENCNSYNDITVGSGESQAGQRHSSPLTRSLLSSSFWVHLNLQLSVSLDPESSSYYPAVITFYVIIHGLWCIIRIRTFCLYPLCSCCLQVLWILKLRVQTAWMRQQRERRLWI